MNCYSDEEITYIIIAHGIAKQGITGIEEKINDSILRGVQFNTLTNEGDVLRGKTDKTKIDSQIIKYKKELDPEKFLKKEEQLKNKLVKALIFDKIDMK